MTGPQAWSVTRDCLRTASGSCSFGAQFVTVSRPFRIRGQDVRAIRPSHRWMGPPPAEGRPSRPCAHLRCLCRVEGSPPTVSDWRLGGRQRLQDDRRGLIQTRRGRALWLLCQLKATARTSGSVYGSRRALASRREATKRRFMRSREKGPPSSMTGNSKIVIARAHQVAAAIDEHGAMLRSRSFNADKEGTKPVTRHEISTSSRSN